MGIENRKCDVSFVLPCLQEGSHDVRHVIPSRALSPQNDDGDTYRGMAKCGIVRIGE